MRVLKQSFIAVILAIAVFSVGCDESTNCDQVAGLPLAINAAMVGDSIFAYNRKDNLGNKTCQDIGAQLSIGMGWEIENKSVGGAQLKPEGEEVESPKDIRSQALDLADERGDGVIETLIITGGGNNVLQNPDLLIECVMNPFDPCPWFVEEMMQMGELLIEEAFSRGVKNILYVGYDLAGWSEPFLFATLNNMMDEVKARHKGWGIEFLDMRGKLLPWEVAIIDGFHPTPQGSKVYADHIKAKLIELGWDDFHE